MSTNLQAGHIRFVQHYLPPLPSGEYTLEASQQLSLGSMELHGTTIHSSDSASYSQSATFFVRGERFALHPGDVHAVFPSPGGVGDFSNVLPHLVFNKKVLPWEWTLGGGAQQPQPTGDVVTWMALLVFDAADPIPAPTERTLADLVQPGTGVASYPNLTLAPGESSTDPVTTIDVPVALFNEIAPSSADLAHLAHSRQVLPDHKPSDPGNEQTEYSVVVANRLPGGQRTTVHLVCFEGMATYLPGSGQAIPNGTQQIRLASLHSWQFSSHPETIDFAATLRHVIDAEHPTNLRLPVASQQNPTVTDALEQGYTACNHGTRLGDSTVSWYRGPLVPFAASAGHTLGSPVRNADQLLRYNPQSGMFDTSYAAAWQLGQLLALHDKEYAVALYRWKHANLGAGSPQPPPDLVGEWLGKLFLLHGIPFPYLVPDESMLPSESLRFFQIDPYWMDCLMDGAFSIGRSTSASLAHDEQHLAAIRSSAVASARRARQSWVDRAGGNGSPNTNQGPGRISGFLLSSAVVRAYPGMEIAGFTSSDPANLGAPLPFLRYESLTPDLLLCLFDGAVQTVTFRQPPEGVHFGLSPQGGGYRKVLRALDTGEETAHTVTVPFRSSTTGVVDISGLASSMGTALSTTCTSDVFALEMTEGVAEIFYLKAS